MRRISILFFLLLISEFGFACDICHVYLGLRPNDFKHQIGLNYRNRIISGTLPVISKQKSYHYQKHDEVVQLNTDADLIPVEERYRVVELTGRFMLTERWALRASIPYLISSSEIDNRTFAEVQDLGDPWIMLERRILNSRKGEEERALNHRLTCGLGVKLPLGNTTKQYEGQSIPYDMQPGSGSYDLIGSVEYLLRWRSIGFSGSGVYKYNGSNLSDYRFGNTAQMTVSAFGILKKEKLYFMPSLGWYHELAGVDRYKDSKLSNTGGGLSFVGIGLEMGFKNLSIQAGLQENVHDHLKNSIAPAKRRITAGINYFIN